MIWLDIIDDGAWEDGADEWALLGWASDDHHSGDLASGAGVLGSSAFKPPQSQTTNGHVPAVASNQDSERQGA